MSNYNKYLKYKNKYLDLINKNHGGEGGDNIYIYVIGLTDINSLMNWKKIRRKIILDNISKYKSKIYIYYYSINIKSDIKIDELITNTTEPFNDKGFIKEEFKTETFSVKNIDEGECLIIDLNDSYYINNGSERISYLIGNQDEYDYNSDEDTSTMKKYSSIKYPIISLISPESCNYNYEQGWILFIIKDNNITTYIDKLIEKNLMNYEYTPSYNIKFHLNLIKNFIYKAWIKEKGNGTEYFDWLYSNELKLLEIFFKLLFNDEIKDDIRLLKHYLEILGDNIKDEKLLNNTDNIIFDNTKLT